MRQALLIFGFLVSVTTGLFLLRNSTIAPDKPTQPQPVTAVSVGQFPESNGQVVANDETSTSPPRQISRAEISRPTVASAPTYQKKPVGRKTDKVAVIDNVSYPVVTYEALTIPNDPSANQWWVTNTKLDQAWDIPRGNTPTILAIIDTGFGLKHEEFANRWYTNPGESGIATSESPSRRNCTDRALALNANCNLIDDDSDTIVDNETGPAIYQNSSRLNCTDQLKPLTKDCNQIDDDSNGYIDDLTGWDFSNFDNSVQAGELNPNGSGTTHGTLVTGIAAATGNNNKGIAGVDWETKILPIQALDDDSYGDTLTVGRSIYYAIDRGADVISISLGSDLSDSYVRGAVQAAVAAGIIVVAASGNDGCDCIVYPANYPEALAVGALNTSSLPASFSSFGQNLDILAPGTNLISPVWSAGNQTSAYASGVNGTSFATPMIGGMLTRLISHRPAATPNQLIAALTESTNRLTLSPTVPMDIKYGFGTLDALKSSQRLTIAKNPVQLYALSTVSQGNIINSSQPFEAPGTDLIQLCEPGTVPTTAIYELNKNGVTTYTISKLEQQRSITQSYASSLFAYACLQQPHDNTATVRKIDLFREFKNSFLKSNY